MTGLLISLAAAIISLAGLCWLAAQGFRIGDRPDDARVTARLRESGQPDATRPVVAVTVRNPSGTAVLAAMSVRPRPPLRLLPEPIRPSSPAGAPVAAGVSVPVSVSVPRWTARRRFRAARYDTVGVVPAGADARFTVPVPAEARGYALTAVVGQREQRLRVHRITLTWTRSRSRAPRLAPPVTTAAPDA